MAGNGRWAFGTLLQVGDGGSPTESFTTIAEVKDISGPDISIDTEDITPHDAVGGWEEFIPTILRSGEITFDLNFVPSDSLHGDFSGTGLIDALKNRTKKNYQLVLPTSPTYTWSFAAYVTGFSNSEPVGGVLGASVTLKVTGVLALATP
jgi:predicted secreted protein